VNVFATVTDQRGAPIGGLTKDDFKVFEDGREQKIAVFDRERAMPLSIVMAIDASLSTRKDLPLELESARKFAHAILRPQDGMALYEFSEIVLEVLPFTSDLHAVDRAISRVHPGAATALYDALYLSSDALTRRKGRKVIVVITDGGDTASKIGYGDALRATQIAEAILYPIIMVPIEASAGRDTGGEHALIQLAMDTGGKYYYATSLPELEKAFRQISDELRTQYLVGYYPSNRVSDDFRQIRLTVEPRPDGNNLIVRHRAGYYTSKLH
jgi:Ca-activated chloride channel family protein